MVILRMPVLYFTYNYRYIKLMIYLYYYYYYFDPVNDNPEYARIVFYLQITGTLS